MSDETTKEYTLVKEKRDELQSLHARMDKDELLYFLDPFKLKKLPPYQAEEVPGVSNITLNDPLLYINKAIAIMGGATWQTLVEGKQLTDKQTTTIEQFLADVEYMVDEDLPMLEIPGMDMFTNEQVCLRGRLAARICITVSPDGKLQLDVLPVDTRCYADDRDGQLMAWAAPWFRQSKSYVQRVYSKPGDREFNVEGEYAEVLDFWDYEQNTIFVDAQIVRQQPNPYGYAPFVSVICPVGSSLNTSGAQSHKGESILWANRDIWQEKNKAATILNTMTFNQLFGALQYPNPQGDKAEKPASSPWEPRTVHPMPTGAEYKPVPISDIRAATRLFYSMLESTLQRGSLSAIDYGTLTFPLSAIAIQRLTGSRDDVFMPRVSAKAEFKQGLSRMIIRQAIALDTSIELGEEGSKNTYSRADLEHDFSIKYRCFTDSAEQRIADLSIANASREILSLDTIRREVLKLRDPDGEKVKWESEQAERLDEVLFLYRRARSLLEEKGGQKASLADKLEAKILAKRAITILRQRKSMGQLSELEGKPGDQEGAPRGKDVVPMLGSERGGGASGGAAQQPPPEPQEQKESEEIER